MSKIVLVGANHAGTAAANTILDQYPDNELVIIDRNSNISYLGCGTALWVGRQIEGTEGLFYCSQDVFEKKHAKVYMETEVTNIDFAGKKVYASGKDGKEIVEDYDKLILATGSLPIIPKISGPRRGHPEGGEYHQQACAWRELRASGRNSGLQWACRRRTDRACPRHLRGRPHFGGRDHLQG